MVIKKNVRFAFLVTLVFFSVMVCAAILPQAASAADKPIELKFAYWMPTKHTLHRVFETYAKEVEELTGGRVKITLYPGGALGKPPQQWDMALGGITDITFFMPGYTAGRFPRSTVFDLPLLLGGSSEVNTAIASGVYEKYIAPDYKDAKMMFFFVSEPFTLHTTKKKVVSMSDAKGLKVRSSGAVQSATVKTLGGSPVTMPITTVYTSMEKGVIDGVFTAFTAMVSFRIYDVSKYSINAGLTATDLRRRRWPSP
jgi:TRAP-type C4-dicarboxylate transport system substrate-binding protein